MLLFSRVQRAAALPRQSLQDTTLGLQHLHSAGDAKKKKHIHGVSRTEIIKK